MIQRLTVAALAISLASCAAMSGGDDDPLVRGPKSLVCAPENFPEGSSRPRYCWGSSLATRLVPPADADIYRAAWSGGDDTFYAGGLEVIVFRDGTGLVRPARGEPQDTRYAFPMAESRYDVSSGERRLTATEVEDFKARLATAGLGAAPLLVRHTDGLMAIGGMELVVEAVVGGQHMAMIREDANIRAADFALYRAFADLAPE